MSLTAAGSLPVQREKVNAEEDNMPYDEVMHKFKEGKLHSGSDEGPKVKKRSQAIAILESEKRKAQEGDKEYQPSGGMGARLRDAVKERRAKK